MSYIIAFVTFEGSTKEFPVQCFSTELAVGDEVIVRRGDGKLRCATISQLQYLNWDCNGRIECRKEDSALDCNGNITLPETAPIRGGIYNSKSLERALFEKGWIPLRSKQQMYRSLLANTNATSTAYIFARRNGIDLQILPRNESERIERYSWHVVSLAQGKVVRHSLAHTTFNLYEGMLRFSTSFLANEQDLERYFVPQGSTDKRTDELKEQARVKWEARAAMRNESGDEMRDIYDACSDGSGEPAYLGDGLWISSGGSIHDWGR